MELHVIAEAQAGRLDQLAGVQVERPFPFLAGGGRMELDVRLVCGAEHSEFRNRRHRGVSEERQWDRTPEAGAGEQLDPFPRIGVSESEEANKRTRQVGRDGEEGDADAADRHRDEHGGHREEARGTRGAAGEEKRAKMLVGGQPRAEQMAE